MDSLNYVVQFLKKHKNLVVEIASHRHDFGQEMYGIKLSQKRAQSCVQYMIKQGIPSDRIIPRGYGTSRPMISQNAIDKMPPEKRKKAIALNARTELIVVRTDYK